MPYIHYNANPDGKHVGDCVIRALAKVFNTSWDAIAIDLSMIQIDLHNMQNSDEVWGKYLAVNGFKRGVIPDTCPYCYSIRDFCIEHPNGIFVVATGEHVVAVVDGNYYDTEDSGESVVRYFWERRY